jgi:hypothetical protein
MELQLAVVAAGNVQLVPAQVDQGARRAVVQRNGGHRVEQRRGVFDDHVEGLAVQCGDVPAGEDVQPHEVHLPALENRRLHRNG